LYLSMQIDWGGGVVLKVTFSKLKVK